MQRRAAAVATAATTKHRSKQSKEGAAFAGFVVVSIGVGYYVLRKRTVSGALDVDPERSALTRHTVPLASRLDKDKLRRALEEEDAAASATSAPAAETDVAGRAPLR